MTAQRALSQQFVGALTGDNLGVSTVLFHQQVGRTPDVNFLGRREL